MLTTLADEFASALVSAPKAVKEWTLIRSLRNSRAIE